MLCPGEAASPPVSSSPPAGGAPSPPRAGEPASLREHPAGGSGPAARARTRPATIFISEGEQIRLGIGLLSVVWFAFFFVADARIPQAEHRAEVAYLVASASLGLVWSGPLTVMAGMRLYPRTYTLWQPFCGGFRFVLLQAFGWLLYAGSLMFCLLTLANLSSGHWSRGAHVEGGFVALGCLGLASGILLNMSLDHFDEGLSAGAGAGAAHASAPSAAPHSARLQGAPTVGAAGAARPSAADVLCNAKTLVALLLSLVGVLLFLACDAYRHALSPAALPIASLPFVGAAIVTQGINGPSHLERFSPFQPFYGGSSFVLLQAFGWFTFGGAAQAVALVPTERLGEISGLIPMCGFTGLASQLLLLASLPHFDRGAALRAGTGRPARDSLHMMPSSEAFLSFCFYGWAAIVFVGALVLERGALGGWPLPVNTRGLFLVSTLLLAIATPSAHLAGKRLHEGRGYRAWQPFCGGTMFCVAQGFGWMLYGFFTLVVLIAMRRAPSARVAGMPEVVVFCVGSLAYAMIAFSLEQYDAAAERAPARAAAPVRRAASSGRWTVAWTGEIGASLTMAAVALGACGAMDAADSGLLPALVSRRAAEWLSPFEPDDVVLMTALLLASITLLFAISAATMHVGASRRLRNYRLWMPFQGGDGFVARQALGWTLLAFSQVLLWILVLMRLERARVGGVVLGAGACAAVAQLLLLRSLDFFEKEQVTVRLSGLADPALTIARLGDEIQLLQRLLGSADQPLVSRMLQSILAQLEERAAEASSHGASARPLHVLLTPRAMQLVNLCLIFASTGGVLLADALRATQPQVAQVLLATGVCLACYTIAFSHLFLGRLFHPAYRPFQPFVGSRYFLLLQATGWALLGIALVAASTILYAPVHNVTLDGIVATVGVLLLLAQLLIAISVFAYRPPAAQPPAARGASAAGEWSAAGGRIQATHGQAIALLMSLSALVLFVLADLAPARLGADGALIGVPTAPIIACALVALCGSVAVVYLISCTQMPCAVAIDSGEGRAAALHAAPPPHGEVVAAAEAAEGAAPDGAEGEAARRPSDPPARPARPPLDAPLCSAPLAADVSVVLARGGRFLVSHIFGCALLSLTFLRATLTQVHRLELQSAGQNTLTGLAGLASIVLMLCSQSAGGGGGAVPSGAGAITIRLEAFPGQLLAALGGAARADRRGALGLATGAAWRFALGLRPLSFALALLAALAVRLRALAAGGGGAADAAAALGNSTSGGAFGGALGGALGGMLGGASGAGAASALGRLVVTGSGLAAHASCGGGEGALACRAQPLLLAAARAAQQPPVSLRAAASHLGGSVGIVLRALSPGRAVLLGVLLTAAALVARLLLSARQGVRLRAAAVRAGAAAVEPPAPSASGRARGAEAEEPAASDAAAAPSPNRDATAAQAGSPDSASPISSRALASLTRQELALASASVLAHGLSRLRTACAPPAPLGSAAAPHAEQLGARALALLRSVDVALCADASAAAGAERADSARGGAGAGPRAGAERHSSTSAGGSALERLLSAESLQDTLGSQLPVAQLAALSLCSRTLRARLPPLFWRLRFAQQHGARLSLQPNRMVVPSLRACGAAESSPLVALLSSAASPARGLLGCASSMAAAVCAPSVAAVAQRARGRTPAVVEGLHWKRACVLADGGAELRYCCICSHLDIDADARDGGALVAAPAGRDAEEGSTASGWVVLPCCPTHGEEDTRAQRRAQRHLCGAGAGDRCDGGPSGATQTVTVHRACLERAAAAREGGRSAGGRFECPRCAHSLSAGHRPVRTWSELLAAADAHSARRYARRALLLGASSLLLLWALQAACALDELRERQPAAGGSAAARGAQLARMLAAALAAAVPHARAALFCAHAGCLLELLASRHAWSVLASARSASEHAAHVAIAAAICVCAAVELAEHSALRLHSLHPLFALSLPRSLTRLLGALCSAVFFAGSQVVLLKAWCARSVVSTPRSACPAPHPAVVRGAQSV